MFVNSSLGAPKKTISHFYSFGTDNAIQFSFNNAKPDFRSALYA